MAEYFKLKELKKRIFDESGDETGYRLFELKIPENYPKVLKNISIFSAGNRYTYMAIPILSKPQNYYVKPIHVSGNVKFVEEEGVLKYFSDAKTKEDVDNFTFYNIDSTERDNRFETKSKSDMFLYLGYIEVGNKFVLGKYVSESGITRFKPMFKNRKKIIPPQFKSQIDKIGYNSWILTTLYSLDPSFVDEKNRNYLSSYGVGVSFKKSINRLIELGYLFKNNGKIYDVYTLFDIFDFSYSGFAHDCFNLGNSIDDKSIKELFDKYQMKIEERKEDFAKMYANIISYYISNRFEELLDDPESNKLKILRFLGLDYKNQ